MAHSSLIGIEAAPALAAGRDIAALGPGDNTDSGSDLMGLDPEALDPAVMGAADARDAGSDIGVDRIVTLAELQAGADEDAVDAAERPDDADPDLAFIDAAVAGGPDDGSADDAGVDAFGNDAGYGDEPDGDDPDDDADEDEDEDDEIPGA